MSERKIDLSIELNAPVEAVWRALTEGEEMSRWFAPAARVNPGVGGSVWLSWGPAAEGESRIEVWEPNRALRVGDAHSAVEYFITGKGEATVLRVVQSGFGADAAFDDYFDSAQGGWQYFLFNLKHYLERHAGQPRHMISVRRPMHGTREDAWPVLLQRIGLQPASPRAGDAYQLSLGDQRYSGQVVFVRDARNFAGTVHELNDGLLFIELEAGQETWHCGIWLSVYGKKPDVAQLEQALNTVLPEPVSTH